MMSNVSEVAIWAAPVMIAIIGYFIQREFGKVDKQFQEIREALKLDLVHKSDCAACKTLADERRIHCQEAVSVMRNSIADMAGHIDKLDDCIRIVGQIKC